MASSPDQRFETHPQVDRFLAAVRDGGWEVGAELPFHRLGCFGCGPGNSAGLGLRASAAAGEAVTAELTFDRRFEGAPGVVHGGAVATALDDLFGFALTRILVPAVTVDLRVRYRRAVHVDDPCRLSAEVVRRDERDIDMVARLEQHDTEKVTAEGRFRIIEIERLLTRYERQGG